jgi:diguanylate cyclase (GGDEF)-like protein
MKARLQEIIDLADLRELMRFFYEAAGLPVGILDAEQNWLVAIGWRSICTEFHRVNPKSRDKCLLSEARIQDCLDDEGYLIYPCPNGMLEVAIPIMLEGRPLGYFFLGQFFCQPPDVDFFRRQAIACGFDMDAYLQALSEVPVVSRERIDHLMGFFSRFFNLLARLGTESLQRRRAEHASNRARAQLEIRVEERTRELNRALAELGDLAAQLNESLHQVEHLAVTDSLTETFNRRKFDELVVEEHNRATHADDPFSLIMFDIDHFKQINDRYGHSAGDRVLQHLCHLLRGLIRQGDQLIRWGGEEFLILLPTTRIEAAGPFAERIRRQVEEEPFPEVGGLTISLGVAQLQDRDDIDSLLKRVDNALYQAKQDGRNRVCVADPGQSG